MDGFVSMSSYYACGREDSTYRGDVSWDGMGVSDVSEVSHSVVSA